jgi:uncharacterized iron-regulated membrane protein
MTFRKILFWLHLCTVVAAGIVVLTMSVTGVLLMYEKQMTAWSDRKYRVTPTLSGSDALAGGNTALQGS